jgi:hypothetical protein
MPHSSESEDKREPGSSTVSLPRRAHAVHGLTDAHGRYTALLHSPTGRLERLPRGVRA